MKDPANESAEAVLKRLDMLLQNYRLFEASLEHQRERYTGWKTDRQTDYFIVADPLLVHILNFYNEPVLHSEIL